MNLFLTIITVLYAGVSFVDIIAYLPTIKDLIHKKKSANVQSYLMWTLTSFVAFSYALFVISDLLLEIVTGLTLLFCGVILLLALRLEYRK